MKALAARRCKRAGAPRRLRLFWQLLASFAILIVFAAGGTSGLNSVAYRQITAQSAQSNAKRLASTLVVPLADYYVARGRSWDKVNKWLDPLLDTELTTPGASASYVILDDKGQIAAAGGPHTDESLFSPSSGVPIMVDTTQVGTFILLSVPGASDAGQGSVAGRGASRWHWPRSPLMPELPTAFVPPREVDRQVGRSFIMVALAMGMVGLGLAVIISRRISAPLRRLTIAARQVAGGELRVEVPGSSIQEVDALAQAFNQMARNLLHADQLRRNMTADIAHELRTPLTIIKGKLEGILDGVYPGTAQHIAPVLEEANLLERLIDDLRLLSLAEAGQLPLHREEVDVRELLENVRLSFAREAARHDVDLNVDVAPDTLAVDVDAQRMQQVLGNLVTNSLRYTPKGGRVELRAASQDHRVHILVRDTGAGIAPDELPHIFDRFWRSDKARSHTTAGVGLGLAIARQLVEAQGGDISATSEPGHGTTMIIDLPSVS